METIAIYWEKQVKVYGIMLKSDLSLVHIQLGYKTSFPWHNVLTQLESSPVTFELVTALPDGSNGQTLSIIFDEIQLASFLAELKNRQELKQTIFAVTQEKVELIYLHGPHFQERFGILARALAPLCKEEMSPVVTGCAGNSMYIVVPDGQGIKSTAILQSTFQTPSTV